MYKIKHAGVDGVFFKAAPFLTVFQWLFLLGGIVLSTVGFISLFDAASFSLGCYLTGSGLFFGAAALLIADSCALVPCALEFRNAQQQMVAVAKDGQTAVVPYSMIKDFVIFSKGGHRYYWVSAMLTNGAYWDIFGAGGILGKKQADEVLTILKDNLQQLSIHSYAGEAGTIPGWVSKQRLPGETVYSWQDKANPGQILALLGLFVGVVLIVAGAVGDQSTGIQLAKYTLFAVLVMLMLRWRRHAQRHYLAVKADEVEYGDMQQEKSSGKTVAYVTRTMERKKLVTTYYSLDLAGSNRYSIILVDQGAEAVLKVMREGCIDLGGIFNFIKTAHNLFKINFSQHCIVDIMNFQQEIQRAVFGCDATGDENETPYSAANKH